MKIKTGAVSNSGKICVVLEGPRDRSGDSVLYVSDGGTIWVRLEPRDLIEAVCPVPQGFGMRGDFIAVSSEGTVFDLVEGLPSSLIFGAGYENPGARNRGLLVFTEIIAGVPTAMGFGGQVYVMQPGGTFSPLSASFPVPDGPPEDDVKFVSGAWSDRQDVFYFVGSIITATPDSDAVNAANDAGDADALVAALLAETRPDHGCVFVFDGQTWRQLDIPTNDAIDAVETDGNGTAYLRLRESVFVALPSADDWQILYDDSPISGESRYGSNIVFAAGDTLLLVVKGTIEPFEPPMPISPGHIVEVTAASIFLTVIRSESVLVFDGKTWSRNDPPVQLGG